MGTYYTVSVETIVGYLDCADKSYLAGYQTERNIIFQYKAPGVYIEDTEGALYTSSGWNSSKTVNAIVCISRSHNFRMSLSNENKSIHSSGIDVGSWFSNKGTTDSNVAKYTFTGKTDTAYLGDYERAKNSYNSTYAIYYVDNFSFLNGDDNCYLPSMGQLWLLYQNKSSVDACLSACGGDSLSDNIISSTMTPGVTNQCYPGIWIINWTSGTVQQLYTSVDAVGMCRPVADYE